MQKDVLSEAELKALLGHYSIETFAPQGESEEEGPDLLGLLSGLKDGHKISVVLETLVQRLIRRVDFLDKQLSRSQQTQQQLERKVQRLESQLYRLERLDLLQQQLEKIAEEHRDMLIEQQQARVQFKQEAAATLSSEEDTLIDEEREKLKDANVEAQPYNELNRKDRMRRKSFLHKWF